MPDKAVYKMFDACTNADLRQIIGDVQRKKIYSKLWEEVDEQERKGKRSRDSQMTYLNRCDLLLILYGMLVEEITRIDDTPLEDLPTLINEDWSCPQLLERIKWRLSNAI
jgi:hypothetical protein